MNLRLLDLSSLAFLMRPPWARTFFKQMRSPLGNREEGVRVVLCEQLCMRRTAARRFCCFPCCKCFERRRRRAAERKQLGVADSPLGAQVPTLSIRDRSVF